MKLFQCVLIFIVLIASSAQAGVVVIVSAGTAVESLSPDDVSRIFLGKNKKFPNGEQAVPINQDEGKPARGEFYQKVCAKDEGQYRAYWSQLIFTGKGAPPKDGGDDAAVKELIAKNPNLIGYVNESVVDASVKVVLRLQ